MEPNRIPWITTFYSDFDCFEWCKKPENKNRIYISSVEKGVVENSEPGLVMHMCTPVYQVSGDEAHPKPTYRFSGVLVFALDAGLLAEKYVAPIRSGRTGYGWVIDESGSFLYHLERDFIGQNALGSLSAGVAHEINNPVAVILGFTELLLERFPEDSKEHEILKTIEKQGNNCKRIVENLLAFARIPKKATTETDVVEDLQRVVNVVMNTLLTKKIDLKTDIEENLPEVTGDGQQLEQVFLNIINNATAAMDGGGILTVSAHRSDNMVSIGFTDTGCGIPPENMDKIFEPFFTSKAVGEGTGLGLSVSYGIVKKFGGEIQVRSQTRAEGKDSGTTFTVLLAVADEKGGESVYPVGPLSP